MHWIIELLMRTRRLRGLSESQLKDLIHIADDVESLKVLKEHVESGNFRFVHLENKTGELLDLIAEKAKDIQWQQHAGTIRKELHDKLGDPLAWALEQMGWFV